MKSTHIVVLTGAGISAESGLQTFRGAGGLWNGHDVMEVASPEGWAKNPALVLEFYNQRRADAWKAQPNAAHKALAKLESKYKVSVITQNVDDLHERGGSSRVLHLHGMLRKVRSEVYPGTIYDYKDKSIHIGDTCPKGTQLRPHIVWFGENVPKIPEAISICETADMFIIIGTSLNVYPAASLIHYVHEDAPKFLIDPNIPDYIPADNLSIIEAKATIGVTGLVERLLNQQE